MFFLLWQRAEIGLGFSENTRICETSSIFGILFTLTMSKGNRLEANQPLTKPSNRIGGGTACSSFRNKNGSLGKDLERLKEPWIDQFEITRRPVSANLHRLMKFNSFLALIESARNPDRRDLI